MKPAAIDLVDSREIYQGDDYQLDLYFFQTDGITPLDLTGYTLPKSQIRQSLKAPATLVKEFTTAFDADRTTGHVILTLASVDTAAMADTTTNVWDYEMVDANSKKATWFAGAVTVIAEVTHA